MGCSLLLKKVLILKDSFYNLGDMCDLLSFMVLVASDRRFQQNILFLKCVSASAEEQVL